MPAWAGKFLLGQLAPPIGLEDFLPLRGSRMFTNTAMSFASPHLPSPPALRLDGVSYTDTVEAARRFWIRSTPYAAFSALWLLCQRVAGSSFGPRKCRFTTMQAILLGSEPAVVAKSPTRRDWIQSAKLHGPIGIKKSGPCCEKTAGLPLGACPQIISSKSGASDRRVPTPGINIWRVNFREESDDSFW